MKHRVWTAALAAAALSFGAAPASALSSASPADGSTVAGPDAVGHELRVVNNHMTEVRVFVTDAAGRTHHLGRVRRGQYKVLNVSADIAAKGPVQVKFFPADPAWSPMTTDRGIQTSDIDLADGQAVHAFLEAELTGSVVEIASG